MMSFELSLEFTCAECGESVDVDINPRVSYGGDITVTASIPICDCQKQEAPDE